ncbi:hypothetical protein FIV42_10415 [Persicimonas caeni]|uniref:SMI1/KNR4 family protein n=1 Tax=Persicimonas caeni TaxID=2292766 RepID=A0A4Y6PSC5_PERCE|nr:hypothetical protein [Persicimonas caeni]QDG51133.1 hypothetical protein FIV42_10415 [Persicimonas caeni]QED32354.1 hypothetical protein FRD00_10410 [Persicimonas caeni]
MTTEAIKDEMRRIFGDLEDIEIYDDEMPLLASGDVPDDIVALVTCFEEDKYFNGEELTGSLHQMLYGAWGFDETNGDFGMLADMIESGGVPEGTYEIGEHLVVDSTGAFGTGEPGAVYVVSSDYALDDPKHLGDSILDFLEQIDPVV